MYAYDRALQRFCSGKSPVITTFEQRCHRAGWNAAHQYLKDRRDSVGAGGTTRMLSAIAGLTTIYALMFIWVATTLPGIIVCALLIGFGSYECVRKWRKANRLDHEAQKAFERKWS